MSGTAKQSDTEQQTQKDTPSALPATHVTMLGISIAGILQAGGTWPPVGTIQRTASETQRRNAMPAICTTRGGNGISVEDLTALSVDELKALCNKQNFRESMASKNLGHCLTVTNPNVSYSLQKNLRSLSDQQRDAKIHELRNRLHKLLRDSKTGKSYYEQRINVTKQLYFLTGYHGYNRY